MIDVEPFAPVLYTLQSSEDLNVPIAAQSVLQAPLTSPESGGHEEPGRPFGAILGTGSSEMMVKQVWGIFPARCKVKVVSRRTLGVHYGSLKRSAVF